jgi:hypothetical protein
MLKLLRGWLYGPSLPTVEQWAQHNSTKASADGIIVAKIVDSFARHFDDWKVTGDYKQLIVTPCPPSCSSLKKSSQTELFGFVLEQVNGKFCQKISVSVKVRLNWWSEYKVDSINHEWGWVRGTSSLECLQLCVNDVDLDPKLGLQLVHKYSSLAEQLAKAKAVAEKAKREQALNEKKWNLAEELLGMTRNEFGALVPKQQATA